MSICSGEDAFILTSSKTHRESYLQVHNTVQAYDTDTDSILLNEDRLRKLSIANKHNETRLLFVIL
jgi:hypothetical protein